MPLNVVAKAAITVAMTAANMALTMSRKIEGPRLDDLKFTSGDYGVPLPMVWGKRRMDVPVFWAEDLSEVKRRRKTKGGKYNEYTYFGTWAVALAGHEIEGVTRVWFDTHLVFDMTGAGPVTPFGFGDDLWTLFREIRTDRELDGRGVSETAKGSRKFSSFVAVYTGSETQEPDPRMQATVEAEFGEGSCPAYRGTAYIAFKDIPLEKFGNRIPQVSVEIVSSSADEFVYESLSVGVDTDDVTFAPDFSYMAMASFSDLALVDPASRQVMLTSTLGEPVGAVTNYVAPSPEGQIYALNSSGDELWRHTPEGQSFQILNSAQTNAIYTGCWPLMDNNGSFHYGVFGGENGYVIINGVETNLGAGVQINGFFVDLDGHIWATGVVNPGGLDPVTTATFYQLSAGGSVLRVINVTGLPADNTGAAGAVHYRDDDTDRIVFPWDGDLYAIDFFTGAVIDTYSYPGSAFHPSFKNIQPGVATVWAGGYEINLADLTLVRSVNASSWGKSPASPFFFSIYVPALHALMRKDVIDGESIEFLYLDRVSDGGVTLETICNDVADMCGVEDYDFSDLDQTITGWSATRGQASNMIEPLLDAYDSDFRPHDFTIEGIKRTGVASGGTLETEWFASDPRYTIKVRQSSELPRAVLIDFADTAAEQQPNSVRTDRPVAATDAKAEVKLDLTTLALGVDEARQLADRYFRRRWNERREIALSLTAKELKLEPGDVRTLELDGEELDARCVKVTVQADDKLATEWRYDHPSLAVLNGASGASFDGRDEAVIVVPMLTKGFVLDIPLLSDADDATTPQVYTLAAPISTGAWPGATIYQSVDGEYSEELANVASSSPATWGIVSEQLPYANPNLWDRGTEITVELKSGTLTGCTEAAANANPALNLAAIGGNGRWEIVQFTTATLVTGTTYTVSGFKRGRRGTEWAAELHEANDAFVLLETADPQAMGLAEVGTAVSFKAITEGRTTGFAFGYSYEGQTLMPYAPAHLKAVKESNGDWTITWVRRTRLGGAWVSGSSVPLGEDSEEYEVDILDSGTVVRTFTATDITENGDGGSVTYTAAQQTTDFGGEVTAGNLEVAAYQISADVDRGFAAELTA